MSAASKKDHELVMRALVIKRVPTKRDPSFLETVIWAPKVRRIMAQDLFQQNQKAMILHTLGARVAFFWDSALRNLAFFQVPGM